MSTSLEPDDAEYLKFDFSDMHSALDRTMRSITMIADGAIQRLMSLGWDRKSIGIESVGGEPLPCWVTLKGNRKYEIRLIRYDDGRIVIQGEWIDGPYPPGVIDRIMGR